MRLRAGAGDCDANCAQRRGRLRRVPRYGAGVDQPQRDRESLCRLRAQTGDLREVGAPRYVLARRASSTGRRARSFSSRCGRTTRNSKLVPNAAALRGGRGRHRPRRSPPARRARAASCPPRRSDSRAASFCIGSLPPPPLNSSRSIELSSAMADGGSSNANTANPFESMASSHALRRERESRRHCRSSSA